MRLWPLGLVIALSLLSSACSSAATSEGAIESYLEALIAKDVITAINTSCLAWEENARAEGLSFEAVEARLEELSCREVGTQGVYLVVACDGKIVANYGGEDQDIDLSDRNYLALYEDYEWKMCGYVGE